MITKTDLLERVSDSGRHEGAKQLFRKTKLLGAWASLALLAGSAQAADLGLATDQSIAIEQGDASAYDWTGLYFGGVASYATGEDQWPDGPYELDDSFFGGVFAGYNYQIGQLVLGGEILGQFGKMKEADYPTLWYENIIDVKARAGFAIDRTLLYVSGGYSLANIEEDGEHFSMDGYNVGLGADFALTENVIIGVEYSYRDIDGTCVHDVDVEGNVSTFQARASYKF